MHRSFPNIHRTLLSRKKKCAVCLFEWIFSEIGRIHRRQTDMISANIIGGFSVDQVIFFLFLQNGDVGKKRQLFANLFKIEVLAFHDCDMRRRIFIQQLCQQKTSCVLWDILLPVPINRQIVFAQELGMLPVPAAMQISALLPDSWQVPYQVRWAFRFAVCS